MVNKLSAYKTYLLFSAITAMCFSLGSYSYDSVSH